jgi:hypothetical protein
MRYGCYKPCGEPHARSLLAGGVIAGAVGRFLVALYRFSDAGGPLLPAATGRAVSLAPVAMGADHDRLVAPSAVEHPVALVDGSNSCQK